MPAKKKTAAKKGTTVVPLVSPAGNEITPANPMEANNLVYAHGYKPKSGDPDAAVASAAVADPASAAEPHPQNVTPAPAK